MNITTILGYATLAIGVAGCANDGTLSERYYKPSPSIHYDVPPQIIYRIDDHRFISLENYDLCDGDTYFNNTKENIHTKLGNGGIEYYRGRLIIDDPSGMNVVIPSARPGPCGDRGCDTSLIYSTDGGRTFKGMVYMNSGTPSKASENYSILVAKDGFYVVKTTQYGKGKIDNRVIKYPLFPGLDFDDRKPYPPGVHDEYLSNKPLPNLRTPSGQDRFTCDASIRPSNLPQKK